ncbi:hypothetical protein [Sansalvadorimonas verongulae]|uniref:hypothetical protein n=1 Tax=Sansalvadorimonas verongulae TaxID=2172824 RepID=UPI0012BC2704|nr:hypothetical protein [Sansalvadorimonas verongulae]
MNRKPFIVQYRRADVVYPEPKWEFHSSHQTRALAKNAIEDQELQRPGVYEMRIRGRR